MSLYRYFLMVLLFGVAIHCAKAEEEPKAEPPPAADQTNDAEPQPTPEIPPQGFGKDTPNADGAPAKPKDSQELSLVLQTEPDGLYVAFTDFLNVLKSIDANARGEWDGLLGVFRIMAAGRSMQALANQPVLVIDGRYKPVSKPLRVRSGTVLVPIESVKILLKTLNFEFEVEGDQKPAATPTPAAPAPGITGQPAPVATPHTPVNIVKPRAPAEATPSAEAALAAAKPPEVQMVVPEGPLLSPVINQSLPPLDIPAVGANVTGLTWGQLADGAHNQPPRRLSIVCDPSLAGLAEEVRQLASRALGLEATIFSAEKGRENPGLAGGIARVRPELVLDLMLASQPTAGGGEAADHDFEIWAVHEALWPAEARASQTPARPMQQLYKVHQFQSLALGSMLRGELTRGFPDRNVRYTLTPSYLLRRIDAPSAAVLIPGQILHADSNDIDRTARAIAGGVVAYCRGIELGAHR